MFLYVADPWADRPASHPFRRVGREKGFELARVRRRGYATAFGEFDNALNAVAAPVYDARGQVAAAVDVWGPSFRVTPARVPELVQQVRASAAAVSVRLGGTAA